MEKNIKIKLLLIDDHQILLDGLNALLKNDKRFEIVGETTSCVTALEMIPAVKPDIIIADISMPGMTGIEFSKIVADKFPDIKILALSMYRQQEMISQMIEAGVSGYLIKNTGKKELIEALLKIYSGGIHFSGEVAAELNRNISETRNRAKEENIIRFTPREKEIINLILKELTNKQIADTLFISERTVETHRKNIFQKAGARNIMALVNYVIHHGFLENKYAVNP